MIPPKIKTVQNNSFTLEKGHIHGKKKWQLRTYGHELELNLKTNIYIHYICKDVKRIKHTLTVINRTEEREVGH